ncbi:phosphatidylinositol-specific phospholipase C [Streptomyces sp. HNM0575]|uniref:phosphatidylinositol-specific phospholipase C domain-containing protein n=1 Tax=Streptomyces sp. HNM0575 TaxID=2716338 RepID=UPI00145C991B|nr:phosphatidylinositol-specific phospholipase C domain-containing protein [Streptomyces sp. HNM0575]NLU75748.1 phosphatidylinositol-specific phospholipase C [Streptomyces sp. HNM0575]
MDLKRRHFLRGTAAIPLAVLLGGTAAGVAEAVSSDAETAGPEAWMSQLPDGVRLPELTVPGTHNSGATHGGPWTECQNTSLTEQLSAGIRFLDIRCRLFDGSFTIHHGSTYQYLNFEDVLGSCREFLTAQPSETILMRLKQEYSEESAEQFRVVFEDYLDGDGGWRSLFRLDPVLPDLGDARGRVVLLGDSDGLPGVRYGDPELFDVQDAYMEEPGAKYPLIEDQFRKAVDQPGKLYVNFVSTAALLPLRSNADRLNPRVRDLVQADENSSWRGLGIVPMDFPNEHGVIEALLKHQPAAAT